MVVLSLTYKLIILSALILCSHCALTGGPSGIIISQKGSTLVLPCSTDLSLAVAWQLDWSYDEDDRFLGVYEGRPPVINKRYRPRFTVASSTEAGQYNLTIANVQLSDSGRYRCIDDEGGGLGRYFDCKTNEAATADVTVIDGNLTCSFGNESIMYSSNVQIICEITYRGNRAPDLIWSLVRSIDSDAKHGPTHSTDPLQDFANYTIHKEGLDFVKRSTLTIRKAVINSGVHFRCSVPLSDTSGVEELTWTSNKSPDATPHGIDKDELKWSVDIFSIVIGIIIGIALYIPAYFAFRQIRMIKNEEKKESSNPDEKEQMLKDPLMMTIGQTSTFQTQIHLINLDKLEDCVKLVKAQPQIRSESVACVISNRIYFFGLGQECNEVWSVEDEQWSKHRNTQNGRFRHCATVVGDRIYILGGCDFSDNKTLDSIECYDTATNSWVPITAQLHKAVWNAACVTYDENIYVFGGADSDGLGVNDVQMIDPKSNSSTELLNSMLVPDYLIRAVVYHDKAFIIGRNACSIYDFERDTWLERNGFKTDVHHFGLTLHNDTLYIAGGGTDGYNNQTNAYVWTCTDEVKSLKADDFLKGTVSVKWTPHAKLTVPSLVYACSTQPLHGRSRRVSEENNHQVLQMI